MSTLCHDGTKIQLLNNQVSTLLFCALESSSSVEIQTLIEMAIEKNEAIKSEINQPKATKQVPTILNSFSARLKMALIHTKTTQAALAWAINVSQGTISQIVTGKVKEAGIVRSTAIAEALGVSANWLLYGEGEMYSKQPVSLESQIARLKFSGSNS